MVREARKDELDALLELYLNLHEEGIPEHDEHLAKTWEQIMDDPNHHIIVKELDAEINQILKETGEVRKGLNGVYMQCLELFGKDYSAFTSEQKKRLGSLVNYTKALSALFGKTVTPVSEEPAEEAAE